MCVGVCVCVCVCVDGGCGGGGPRLQGPYIPVIERHYLTLCVVSYTYVMVPSGLVE